MAVIFYRGYFPNCTVLLDLYFCISLRVVIETDSCESRVFLFRRVNIMIKFEVENIRKMIEAI